MPSRRAGSWAKLPACSAVGNRHCRRELLVYIERVRTADGVPAMLSSEWHVPGTFELPVYRRPLAGGGG